MQKRQRARPSNLPCNVDLGTNYTAKYRLIHDLVHVRFRRLLRRGTKVVQWQQLCKRVAHLLECFQLATLS